MSTSNTKVGDQVRDFTEWLSRLFDAVVRLEKDQWKATGRVLNMCAGGLDERSPAASLADSSAPAAASSDPSRSLDSLLKSFEGCGTSSREAGAAGGSNMPLLQREVDQLAKEGKLKLFQERMLAPYQRKRVEELRVSLLRMFGLQFVTLNRSGEELDVSYKNFSAEFMNCSLGCKHYARNCKVYAKCCRMYVTCRLCHDEMVLGDHEMDRFAVDAVLCSVCKTSQSVGESCVRCKVRFASHFCASCKFYENTPGRNVYHCDKCGLCRRGMGLGIDNYHCDTCDACVSLASREHHKCKNSSLRACCPVCREYLFTSTKAVVFMRCGHAMHSECFNEYLKSSYRCPYCFKSLMNMRGYFEQIDALVATETMPPEYAKTLASIFCNDCEERSTTKYHYLYLKCKNGSCGSYNTRLLELVDPSNPNLECFLGECEKR